MGNFYKHQKFRIINLLQKIKIYHMGQTKLFLKQYIQFLKMIGLLMMNSTKKNHFQLKENMVDLSGIELMKMIIP